MVAQLVRALPCHGRGRGFKSHSPRIMKTQWNEVTWYSRLGTIVFLLLCVPVLAFYIGRSYQDVVHISEAAMPNVEVYSTTNNWARLNIEEDESIQLFKSVREYIEQNDKKLLYSKLILDKRNKEWIIVKINPEVERDFVSTQVYVKKEGGIWKVMGIGTVPTKLCSEYPELGC